MSSIEPARTCSQRAVVLVHPLAPADELRAGGFDVARVVAQAPRHLAVQREALQLSSAMTVHGHE
jgi:hypothetical protein